jgi:nucleotide-binding universal stress UspA family protein
MLHNILLVYQNTLFSRRVFDLALDLTQKYQSHLHFFALINREYSSSQLPVESHPHFRVLRDLQDLATQYEVESTIATSCGDLAVSVSNYVQNEHCDLIVIGNRHIHQGWNIFYFEAVDYLMKYIDCSVIVVKSGASLQQPVSEVI